MNRLKTGITNTSYSLYGFDKGVEKIKEHGYDCIDYQGFIDITTDFFNLPRSAFIAQLNAQKELFISHGLEVSQAHSPWRYPPKDYLEKDRAEWLAAMKKAIIGTHVLGCARFVVHPIMPFGISGDRPDDFIKMNDDFLAEIADFAKEYGVTVCLENMPFPGMPITTVEDCVRTVERLGKDNLKICLDTGHAAIFEGKDLTRVVKSASDKLEAVHVHDNGGKKDEHLVPGDGIIDWKLFGKALCDVGFSGVISIETSAKCHLYPEEKWDERERSLAAFAAELAKWAHK